MHLTPGVSEPQSSQNLWGLSPRRRNNNNFRRFMEPYKEKPFFPPRKASTNNYSRELCNQKLHKSYFEKTNFGLNL